MLTVKGVVLMQRTLGEQDRFIDILTAECGMLEVLVKGAGKISGRAGSATQLFAYSEFCLNDRKKGVRILNSISPISIFYGLRRSVTAVALASYFSQVIQYAVLPRDGMPEILRLMLNCLHFLSEDEPDEAHIKAVFELRMASLLGFMPDVVMCRKCGAYQPEKLLFLVEEGWFCCKECHVASDEMQTWIEMPAGALQAVRHIVLSDFERIFSFRVGDASGAPLYAFAESFLQYHIDRRFPTLDYYKTLAHQTDEHRK